LAVTRASWRGLEEVEQTFFERGDDVGREVRDAEVVVDEAGAGEVGGCFTREDGFEVRGDAQQCFARPAWGAPTPGGGRRVALGVPGGAQHTHQLLWLRWDEVGQCRAELVADGADCGW
jgi:hypothetical protein